MDQFIRGKEDIYREFELTENGVALDASVFTEIEISFRNIVDGVLALYKLTDTDVTVVDADLGTVSCIIPKETTEDARLGKYNVVIETSEPNVSYPNNTRNRAGRGFTFNLVK